METLKHNEKYDKWRIKLSGFISFLLGFSEASIVYIESSYFKQSIGSENFGPFYIFSYLVALLLILNLHKIIKIFGKSNSFFFSIIIKIISLVFLNLTDASEFGVLFLMVYIIATAVEWVCLDAIIESFSVDKMSGRIRGLHLTIINAGFIFGPFVSTYLLDKIGFGGVFTFSLIFNSFILIFGLIGLRKINHDFKKRVGIMELIRKVKGRKNITRIYCVSFALEFFYAAMVIYTPIYLFDLGYSWMEIGKIFTVTLLPFVIFQYPAGFLADKKTGEKEFIIASIFIMGASTIVLYFLGVSSILVWMAALFFTRVGASLIEILRDSYFYKRVDGQDVDMISFFRTARPAAYIIAPLIFSLLFFALPNLGLNLIFLITGIAVLLALYPAFKLADNKCEREMEECKDNV